MRTAEACQSCSQISTTGKVVCVHPILAKRGVLKPRDYCETRCRMYVTVEGRQVPPSSCSTPNSKPKPKPAPKFEYFRCIHRDRRTYEDRGHGCGRQARVYPCALHGECYLHKPSKVQFPEKEFPGVRECKSCPELTLQSPRPSG